MRAEQSEPKRVHLIVGAGAFIAWSYGTGGFWQDNRQVPGRAGSARRARLLAGPRARRAQAGHEVKRR